MSIDAFIAREQPHAVAFLAQLVRQPSDNPPGDCEPAADLAARLLRGLGFSVEAHRVPEAQVRANGMLTATNLIVRERFGNGGPTIALNAHGDVVPPGSGWSHAPYGAEVVEEAEHGKVMYGRGVAVSKSDFATYAWAMLALKELHARGAAPGLALNGCVELHCTYDEEMGGGIGPQWLLERGLTRPDLAICAGFAYAVTTAHNGCLHLEVDVQGKPGHAALPTTGIDALEAATAILSALYQFRGRLRERSSKVPGITQPTLNIGTIAGGINTNVIPDRVLLRLDRRVLPEESMDAAEAELRVLLSSAVVQAGIKVDVRRLLRANPLVQLPGAKPLIDALCRHGARVLGTPLQITGVPLYTDARHYASAGIPTVLYGAGPRTLQEANGHGADECLRLTDLHAATRVIAATLAELLGRQASREGRSAERV
jgi:acetylornithine deacetylase/succinyl-diaminopimelate desuccinylase-like protein